MSYVASTTLSDWYHDNPQAGYPGEKHAMLPGGANPALAGKRTIAIGGIPNRRPVLRARPRAVNGLGYDFTIGTPLGDQTISIPIEKAVTDATTMAMNTAIPLLKKQMPAFMAEALKAANADIVGTLWPELQPKLQDQIDATVALAKTELRRDLILTVGAIVLSVAAATIFLKPKR